MFFTRYSPPPSPSLACSPETSKTRQEFLAESDINRLVIRYQETGSFYDPITDVKSAARKPFFADVSNLPDYQGSLDIVIRAQSAFDALPSAVRDKFANDPQSLITWLQDESNYDEAVKLGLINKKDDPVISDQKSVKDDNNKS